MRKWKTSPLCKECGHRENDHDTPEDAMTCWKCNCPMFIPEEEE